MIGPSQMVGGRLGAVCHTMLSGCSLSGATCGEIVGDQMSIRVVRETHGQISDLSDVQLFTAERLLLAGLRAADRADESDVANRRLALLLKASQRLGAALEPATVAQALLEHIVPEFGDAAVLHFSDAGRRGRQVKLASSEGLGVCSPNWWDLVERATRRGTQRASRFDRPEIGWTGCGHVVPGATDCRDLGYLIVPLRARGRTLATLTTVALHRRYVLEDLPVIETLGHLAGLALDNVQLHAERGARAPGLQPLRGQLDAAQSESLREDERRRIARDLHDHLEQTLFTIGLTAVSALAECQHYPPLVQALTRVSELSSSGAEQVQAAIFALNHADFARLGLTQALWQLVRSFQQRTSIAADLVLHGGQRPVTPEVAEALLATAREALTNVERHAQAGAVVVGVRFSPKSITLTVQDDGAGASGLLLERIGSSVLHFGLRGLQERVRRLRGTFASGPNPDGGFMVRARIPLHAGSNV